MSKKTLYVILDKKFLKEEFYKSRKDVFTLNEYVLSDKEKEKFNHFFPNPKKTAREAECLFLKTNQLKNLIYEKIKKNKYFNNIKNLSELLEPFLEIKISQYFYLNSIIPKYNNYLLIYGKQNVLISTKVELVIAIEKINNTKNVFVGKFSNLRNNNNLLNKCLLEIQKLIIKKIIFLNKKKVNFFSDERSYFMKYLTHKFKKKGVINLYLSTSTSLLRNIKVVLSQTIQLLYIKNIKKLELFLIPYNVKPYKLNQFNLDLEYAKFPELNFQYLKYLNKQIYDYLLITENYFEYLEDIFKRIRIRNSFFHSMRFPDFFSISRILNKYNNDVFLLSHGSHTKQLKEIDIKASKSIALGLTYTRDDRIKIISQSSFCDEFLDSLKIKYLRSNFIISKVINKKSNFIKTKETKETKETKKIRKTKILYIGTAKSLGARRYYYESSAELIGSIIEIYNRLEKFKNLFEINIRVRDVENEINSSILKNAFKDKFDLLNFQNNLSLQEEIKKSACIISFSSTTLEEALNFNKPVMCFGLPSYNHLKNYDDFNLKNKYIQYNYLNLIEKALGRKFIVNQNIQRKLDYRF